jgi:hypothetical protein
MPIIELQSLSLNLVIVTAVLNLVLIYQPLFIAVPFTKVVLIALVVYDLPDLRQLFLIPIHLILISLVDLLDLRQFLQLNLFSKSLQNKYLLTSIF